MRSQASGQSASESAELLAACFGGGRLLNYFIGTFFNFSLNSGGFGLGVPQHSREWEKGFGWKWADKAEEPRVLGAVGRLPVAPVAVGRPAGGVVGLRHHNP